MRFNYFGILLSFFVFVFFFKALLKLALLNDLWYEIYYYYDWCVLMQLEKKEEENSQITWSNGNGLDSPS